MKKVPCILVALILLAPLHAQMEDFIAIETSDMGTHFCVHTEEEGPGVDIFNCLLLRLHLDKRMEPEKINAGDKEVLPFVLKTTGSRYPASKHNRKFYFEFPSNAPWKTGDAKLTLFINDDLLKSYNEEIRKDSEVWLFITVYSYDTFKMEGYGRIVEFLSKKAFLKHFPGKAE